MSRNIVVGVDGTETAAKAARTAAEVGQAFGAHLHVISAYGPAEVQKVRAEGREYPMNHEERARDAAEENVAALRTDFPDLDMVAKAAPGKPAEALVEFAEGLPADLIVVGNKRVQGMARVLGSIATDVAHKAPCDVYIAHTHD